VLPASGNRHYVAQAGWNIGLTKTVVSPSDHLADRRIANYTHDSSTAHTVHRIEAAYHDEIAIRLKCHISRTVTREIHGECFIKSAVRVEPKKRVGSARKNQPATLVSQYPWLERPVDCGVVDGR
jgi:hypothetical protein